MKEYTSCAACAILLLSIARVFPNSFMCNTYVICISCLLQVYQHGFFCPCWLQQIFVKKKLISWCCIVQNSK